MKTPKPSKKASGKKLRCKSTTDTGIPSVGKVRCHRPSGHYGDQTFDVAGGSARWDHASLILSRRIDSIDITIEGEVS